MATNASDKPPKMMSLPPVISGRLLDPVDPITKISPEESTAIPTSLSSPVPTLHAFNEMIAHLRAKGIKEWVENKSENPDTNYSKPPLASIAQMEKVMTKADETLEKITDPVLYCKGTMIRL